MGEDANARLQHTLQAIALNHAHCEKAGRCGLRRGGKAYRI